MNGLFAFEQTPEDVLKKLKAEASSRALKKQHDEIVAAWMPEKKERVTETTVRQELQKAEASLSTAEKHFLRLEQQKWQKEEHAKCLRNMIEKAEDLKRLLHLLPEHTAAEVAQPKSAKSKRWLVEVSC
jgi:hypothetical protein